MNSIYIHIPFCLRKCNYCDFFSVSFNKDIEKIYIKTICNSIKENIVKDNIKTIYFGGGTPSILSEKSIELIFNELYKYDIDKDAEITIETNPATCDINKLKFFRKYFNRISIGVQSFNEEELKLLGRLHTSEDAYNIVKDGEKAGFNNISLDLMYALPFQNKEIFEKSIKKALELPISHLSAYELTIEENTPFGLKKDYLERNIYDDIDFDSVLEEELIKKNIYKYEVSNYSKINYESKHNINYWKNGEYLGFGAGAVGYINRVRYKYVCNVDEYIKSLGKKIEFREKLSDKELAFENLMLGLRMVGGVEINYILKYLNNIEKDSFLNNVESLKEYVYIENNYLKTTKLGMNYLNSLIIKLYNWK